MPTATAKSPFVDNISARVGQAAPDFDLPSTRNLVKLDENVRLADYRGKWLVLLFYPLDFTFVCPTELTAFSDRYDEFEGIGAEVIGVSTDSVYSHRAWLQTPRDKSGVEGLNYPLAADITKETFARTMVYSSKRRVSRFAGSSSLIRGSTPVTRLYTI
jgi:alkyl hydroperoxide reductase subunit AhpC